VIKISVENNSILIIKEMISALSFNMFFLFWGILLAIVLFGVVFDKLFPNKVKFKDSEHVKSTNQQLNELGFSF